MNFLSYGKINPAFRIFEIDEDTNMIINIKTYRLNITKANSNITAPIEFELYYDFAEVICLKFIIYLFKDLQYTISFK